jgi:primosomal protein N' (replication factor Y)
LLRAEAGTRDAVDGFLTRCAALGRRLQFRVQVYDPVPATIARIAGRERGHLLVQSAAREELQRFLDEWQPRLAAIDTGRVRWALDVDPLDL